MRFFNAAACVLLSSSVQLVAALPTLLPEQAAIQAEQKRSVDESPETISILFDSGDLDRRSFDHVVNIPLDQRVPTRRSDDLIQLPTHPQRARILRTMTTRTVKMDGMFEFEEESTPNVRCVAHPKVEHRPYTWTADDGQIDFDDEASEWYLDGREVASYECSLV